MAVGIERTSANLEAIRHAESKRTPRPTLCDLQLDIVNVLPQTRKTFDQIGILAESIAANGMFNPLIVAQLDREHAEAYLTRVNELWGSNISLENLTSVTNANGNEYWYILIAGERRYRACQYLRTVGCSDCREEHGENHACYAEHRGNTTVAASVHMNISPLKAFDIQASENTQVPVPPDQEAHFYATLFQILRDEYPGYPMARFAREMGRSVDKIVNAIRFWMLPDQIQQLVSDGRLPYGYACEIARLKEVDPDESELLRWAIKVMTTPRYTLPKLHKEISELIDNTKNGQASLFPLLNPEEQQAVMRTDRRETIARDVVIAIHTALDYLHRLNRLGEAGLIGTNESPYATGSPRHVMQKLTSCLEGTQPILHALLTGPEEANIMAIVPVVDHLLDAIEAAQASSHNHTTVLPETQPHLRLA